MNFGDNFAAEDLKQNQGVYIMQKPMVGIFWSKVWATTKFWELNLVVPLY